MLSRFLNSLGDQGRVRIGLYPPRADAEAEAVLREWDCRARLEWPGQPPPLDLELTLWSAARLYEGCQFLVYRDVSAEIVRAAMGQLPPAAPRPAADYSVDLVFRFLPSLYTMARAAAPADPLTECLKSLGTAWPLSSVGMTGIEVTADQRPLLSHPSVRRMYADRIIERSDLSRLAHPEIRQAVRESLGGLESSFARVWEALNRAELAGSPPRNLFESGEVANNP